MIFEKSFKTWKGIKDRKDAEKKRIKNQQKELKDLRPFEARISSAIKISDMLYSNISDLESFNVETDERSAALVNEYIYTILQDFTVKEDEEKENQYILKAKEIEL